MYDCAKNTTPGSIMSSMIVRHFAESRVTGITAGNVVSRGTILLHGLVFGKTGAVQDLSAGHVCDSRETIERKIGRASVVLAASGQLLSSIDSNMRIAFSCVPFWP